MGDSPEQRIRDRDEVERLLRQLHGPEADVIRMYHLEGKSTRLIAEERGLSERAVEGRLRRSRLALRALLSPYYSPAEEV